MHIYTPGDEQYCKCTTRKSRAEADLRVRRSARSSLTTGKRHTSAPLTGGECPRLRTQARSHTCEPPCPTTQPFSLSSPQALATPRARFLSRTSTPCQLPHSLPAQRHQCLSHGGAPQPHSDRSPPPRPSPLISSLAHPASQAHAHSYTPTAASASFSLSPHALSLALSYHTLSVSLSLAPQPAAPFPSHRCPLL